MAVAPYTIETVSSDFLVVAPTGYEFRGGGVEMQTARTDVIPMHWLLVVCSLLLVLADGAASAQPGSSPDAATSAPTKPQVSGVRPAPADMTPAQVRDLIAEYTTQCVQDWDAATHMTKQEWARTCERVVRNRVQFRLEQPKQ